MWPRRGLLLASRISGVLARKRLPLEIRQLNELSENDQRLIKAAIIIRQSAYAPYSGFKVGAVLLTGERAGLYSGCNVEDVAHTGTHAEDSALGNMMRSLGGGAKPYVSIVVVALEAAGDLHAVPCGGCRQRIREFGDDNTVILGARLDKDGNVRDVECSTLGELLPYSFGPENLGH